MASKARAQDLKRSGSTALLGLLRSIAPDAIPEDGQKLDDENIKRINEKLIELFGKDTVELNHNDKNVGDEPVNEESLPIIDITEPAEEAESLGAGTTSIAREDKLIPLRSLPMSQRERLRQERERILDMLEEEERFEEQREREQTLEEKKEAIRKRVEEATKERDRTQAAKEVQKKMGRALLGNKTTDRDKNETTVSEPVPSDSAKPKKCVSFVDEPTESTEGRHSSERETWGDISLATLRPTNRLTLLSKAEEDRQPMKSRVVERKPVGPVSIRQQGPGDSDDESNSDDEDDWASLGDGKSLPAEQSHEDLASDSDATNESLEDLDFAQHQRDIALEYYAKRGIIGQAAAQALVSHSHIKEDNQKEKVLDTGVIEPHPSKPSLSHFKASKLAASFNTSIPSQEGSVLPASSAKTIQKTIRMGKLDSKNQLVGADSGSEGEDETVQQVLELLGKGEVYNVGPEGNQTFYAVPPPKKAETNTAVAVNTTTLPPLAKPKTSKFKVDRSQAGPSTADQSQAKSISPSPTASTTLPTAAAVVERRPPGVVKTTSSPIPSTIVDPTSTPSSEARKLGPQQSMTIDSPLFRPPHNHMSATPFSMIVESPTFPRPSDASQFKSDTLAPAANMPSQAASSQPIAPRRPARPPSVMSSAKSSQSEPQPTKPKKVSRFLAERT